MSGSPNIGVILCENRDFFQGSLMNRKWNWNLQ